MNPILTVIALGSVCVAGKALLPQVAPSEYQAGIDSKWIQEHNLLAVAAPLISQNLTVGETLELYCEMGGTPVPTLYWEFNGEIIQGAKGFNMMEKFLNYGKESTETGITAGSLTIPCIQPSHSGTYKCVGYNGYTTMESVAHIVVDGNPLECKPDSGSAPHVIQWTDTRMENMGNVATLLCDTDKPASISWTFEDHQLQFGGRYQLNHKGSLIIHNIEFSDLGPYYCTASNDFGNITVQTYLHVTKSI